MTRDQACEAIDDFLRQYLDDQGYFTAQWDPRDEDGATLFLSFFGALPDEDDADVIWVVFTHSVEVEPDDPDLARRAQQCLDAAVAAIPAVGAYELRFEFTVS